MGAILGFFGGGILSALAVSFFGFELGASPAVSTGYCFARPALRNLSDCFYWGLLWCLAGH